jgi:hypothetical protein
MKSYRLYGISAGPRVGTELFGCYVNAGHKTIKYPVYTVQIASSFAELIPNVFFSALEKMIDGAGAQVGQLNLWI